MVSDCGPLHRPSTDRARQFDDADMAILHNLGIETDAVIHNARPGTLYDEAPKGTCRKGVEEKAHLSKKCVFTFLMIVKTFYNSVEVLTDFCVLRWTRLGEREACTSTHITARPSCGVERSLRGHGASYFFSGLFALQDTRHFSRHFAMRRALPSSQQAHWRPTVGPRQGVRPWTSEWWRSRSMGWAKMSSSGNSPA